MGILHSTDNLTNPELEVFPSPTGDPLRAGRDLSRLGILAVKSRVNFGAEVF